MVGIPARRTLTAPVTVQLRAGTYPSPAFPQYFESRWGLGERAMITLRSADGRGCAVLPGIHLYDVRGLTLDGVTLRSTGDVFHCERCVGVNILRSRLYGSRASTHENIKANQSRNMRVEDSLISGAEQNGSTSSACAASACDATFSSAPRTGASTPRAGRATWSSPTTSSAAAGRAATWPARARDSSTWCRPSSTTRRWG